MSPGCNWMENEEEWQCNSISLQSPDPELAKLNPTEVLSLCLYKVYGNINPDLFTNLTSLKVLLLLETEFKTFKFKSNTLQSLQLIRNKFPRGSNIKNCCYKLEKLTLKNNTGISLKHEVLSSFKRLRSLDLILQKVKHINKHIFKGLTKLKKLSIVNCSTETIAEDAFRDLSHLQELYIEDNSLRHIHPKAFEPLKQLTSLSIYSNRLPPLPLTTFSEQKRLTQIGLPTNTWKSITVEDVPYMFPRLNFFSYMGGWKTEEDKINTKSNVFTKLTKLLLKRDENIN
ncbi:P-granule-associated novel protein 1-like isoform X2 [Diabrotica virgifera virgifera]|nr:P-granule-associated novel protein 1-like isoform X2 [Diabrotica virgifera virgifera]